MKKIKPIIQHDLKDCGVCCMQWLIIYYDGYISLEKLREDTLTDVNGTSAFHIVTTFKKWGFDSSGILVHDLLNSELKFPLIAHLKLKNGLEHFVIVKEIVNNTVYLMDPGKGNDKLSLTKFNELFTGYVIIASPRSNIIKMEKGLTIKELFFNILIKEKFLFIKIILTSFIWTFLSIVGSYYLKVGSNLLGNNSKLLKYLIIIFGIITILKVFMLYIRNYYENHLSNLVDIYLYPEFIKHLFFLPLKNIKSRSTGEIVTRIEDLANIKSLFSDIFVSCFLDSWMMIISIVILYMINSKITYILILFIIIYAIYGLITSKIIYKKVLKNIHYHTEFNSLIVENITMLESIKNLNVISKILVKIEKNLSKYLLNNYKFNGLFNIVNFGKDAFLEICFFLINSYGFWSIYKGNLTLIDLFTYNLILTYCIDPVRNIVALMPKYNYIKATFNKIMEFINIEEEQIKETDTELKGDIVFENVSYSYNNYDYILKDMSLKIKEGEHILLNGLSGSGKSTICKLIFKENSANGGNILIGNSNIKDLDISVIRKNILYISQNENLFTGTIKDNILIGREIDNNYFENICRICELESIVSKKSFRYDSLIEASHQNISGGEKQRIILARGLMKNVNIIILDEALSEVDSKLETKIIKNIRSFFKDKTIIYISHKNQTKNFENIINIGEKNGLL